MKKVFFLAIVAMMLVGLNSCQYKNPALESSENQMVKQFEVANLLLGQSKTDAEKALQKDGFTFVGAEEGFYVYEKQVGDVEQLLAFKLGSKSKVYVAMVEFEPMSANTYLADFAKIKEVVTTFGSSCKISTKENCDFQLFVSSTGETAKLDYNTMLSRIDSSTNGYECVWAANAATMNADEVIEQIYAGSLSGIYFECDVDDYMSYSVDIAIASQKYK